MWEKGLEELNMLLKCTPLQHHIELFCPVPERWGVLETSCIPQKCIEEGISA